MYMYVYICRGSTLPTHVRTGTPFINTFLANELRHESSYIVLIMYASDLGQEQERDEPRAPSPPLIPQKLLPVLSFVLS